MISRVFTKCTNFVWCIRSQKSLKSHIYPLYMALFLLTPTHYVMMFFLGGGGRGFVFAPDFFRSNFILTLQNSAVRMTISDFYPKCIPLKNVSHYVFTKIYQTVLTTYFSLYILVSPQSAEKIKKLSCLLE